MWAVSHFAFVVSVAGVEGRKPPWNHPHVMPLAFKRSPTFVPDIVMVSRVEQSSKKGCGSPTTEPSTVSGPARLAGEAPLVWPPAGGGAPGVEGPDGVCYWVSLTPTCC